MSPAVAAANELRHPAHEAVERHAAGGVAEKDRAEGAPVGPHELRHFPHWDALFSGLDQILAHRLAHREHHQQHDEKARDAHHYEGELPRRQRADQGQVHRPRLRDQANGGAAEHQRQPAANENAGGVNAHRATQLLRRKVVGDHGIGGGGQGGLAHADQDPGGEKLHEAAGQAAGGGGQAPQENARRDDGAPAVAVGQAGDGHPHGHVEDGEGEPHQQAHLGVADAEVGANGRHQQGDHLPVDERHHHGEHQDDDHVPGVDEPPLRRLRGGVGRWLRTCCLVDGRCPAVVRLDRRLLLCQPEQCPETRIAIHRRQT